MTGYTHGGCSPVGMKKLYPTFIDLSAKMMSEIIVSAGKREKQIKLFPQDLQKITNGVFVDIVMH